MTEGSYSSEKVSLPKSQSNWSPIEKFSNVISNGAHPEISLVASAALTPEASKLILNTPISQPGSWVVAQASVVVLNPPPEQTPW